MRRVIPSCVVTEIRKQFPEETETYTGFVPGEEEEDDDNTPEYEDDWMLEAEA